ncbi:islet cell autoantigen 1 isoform X1 [Petromyzon marinus]|uniref:islet cell autoantigen 1 isoform X1 n=1 Tax=Petromyzon marinus TaxID=7757 RepID=UPI003F704103
MEQGYSREAYDRHVRSQDRSVVNKVQQKFWRTKQVLIRATGKKEDAHVVAGDAALDSKLGVFHSIQRTCFDLLKVVERYQKRLCALSQEENEMGRFLKQQGNQDKTRAGKIMHATGKNLCYSSQLRLSLRHPLSRLYQDVHTFRCRAVADTWLTMQRMEEARTEYRGALLWMKDVSQELDPDTYKQLEKFRQVQTEVRASKMRFDKLTNDVCQKVDLLGASRCNLLSSTLTAYQSALLQFWEKTASMMSAVQDCFKGYQPYEFTTLKSLQDPMKKLSENPTEEDADKREDKEGDGQDIDTLVSLDEGGLAESAGGQEEGGYSGMTSEQMGHANAVLLAELGNSDMLDLLAELGEVAEGEDGEKDDLALLNEIMNAPSDADFGSAWQAVFGGELSQWPMPSPAEPPQSGDGDGSCGGGGDGDHLMSLAPGLPGQVTGTAGLTPLLPAQTMDPSGARGGFLPSELLDMNYSRSVSGADWDALRHEQMGPGTELNAPLASPAAPPGHPQPKKGEKPAARDMSAWFSLFADLDPLGNPDAVGRTDSDHELLNA